MKLLKAINLNDNEILTITRGVNSIQNKYKDNEYMSSSDINTLKGAFFELVRDFQEEMNTPDAEAFRALKNTAICDNKLYLNSFEGYTITPRLNLRALYLNKYNQAVALIEDSSHNCFLYGLL